MTIFTPQNLYRAYKDCIKNKKNTVNALEFEMDREKNLSKLLYDLKTRKYEISRHICFVVTHPTPREIFAADFRDRIVHHVLYREIRMLFEKDFIEHSYANRTGKGTHRAMKTVHKEFIRGGKDRQKLYCLKLDIESFFRSINKEILYSIVEKKILLSTKFPGGTLSENKNLNSVSEEILWVCKKIIFHDPTLNFVYKGDVRKKILIPKHKSLFNIEGSGLPIGNLTSQFFANVYLNELDQFITTVLEIKRYVRYVDDFVLIDEDEENLKLCIRRIDLFLWDTLRLKLHRGKIRFQEAHKGVDFLGYYIKPSHVLVRQKIVRRYKTKLNMFKRHDSISEDDIKKFVATTNSYFGHFRHAHSFELRKHISQKIYHFR